MLYSCKVRDLRLALSHICCNLQLMFLVISEVTKVDRQSVHDFIKYDSLKNVVSCCNTAGFVCATVPKDTNADCRW